MCALTLSYLALWHGHTSLCLFVPVQDLLEMGRMNRFPGLGRIVDGQGATMNGQWMLAPLSKNIIKHGRGARL